MSIMTHDQILNETLNAISRYSFINKDRESIIKLILENLMLIAKIEFCKKITEEK